MKKLFIALLLGVTTLTTLTTFAANWNANTVEELNITEKEANSLDGKIRIECAKALMGKNATNISYAKYKEIIKKTTLNVINTSTTIKPVEKEYRTKNSLHAVPFFAVLMNKFRPFQKFVVRDPEVNSYNFVMTIYYQYDLDLGLTATEKRDGLIRGMKRFKDKLGHVKLYWKQYKKIMGELEAKVAYADLKEFKRMFYMNIQKSDEWKTILVEIELATKALE